jgi:hypothetical protein
LVRFVFVFIVSSRVNNRFDTLHTCHPESAAADSG